MYQLKRTDGSVITNNRIWDLRLRSDKNRVTKDQVFTTWQAANNLRKELWYWEPVLIIVQI